MIDGIKEKVFGLCKKTRGQWEPHVKLVVKYSLILAEKMDADKEIVELAAWLHDVHKIEFEMKDHHVHGSEKAAEILKEAGYSDEVIEKVKHCIITHSSDKSYPPESTEAKIVASADALAHLDMFIEMAWYAVEHYDTIAERKEWLIRKYEKSWGKMTDEARELGKEKYDRIMAILKK